MTKLTDTLLTALVSEDKIAIVSVVSEPGVGTTATINAFAKNEDIDFIDIRCEQLDPTDLLNGYSPVRHLLKTNEPVLVLVDEVGSFTFDRAQKIINQVHEEARGKVVIVLVLQKATNVIKTHGITLFESEPMDVQSSFVEFLRETNKTKTHLLVAEFVEENGLSDVSPMNWQTFALAYDMNLKTAAFYGLGNETVGEQFEAWISQRQEA